LSYNTLNYTEQGGDRQVIASGGSIDVESGGELDIESGGSFKIAGVAVTSSAAELNAISATGDPTFDSISCEDITVTGVATLDHPINLNSITAVTADETADFGNILKVNRSSGAVGGTHSGAIIKHYLGGGAVDGTAVVSGLYVNLKYEPDSENAAAEVSLIEAHLYSNASDAIDYALYVLAPASKIDSLFGVSGTMTNFLEVKAAGAAGMTVSSDGMSGDPHTDNEAGYLTIKVEGGLSYQIPFYSA